MRCLRAVMLAIPLVSILSSCDRERWEPPPATPVRTEAVRRADFVPATTLLGFVRAAQTIPLTILKAGRISYPSRFAGGLRTGERVTRSEEVARVRNDQTTSLRTQARLQMEAADADFDRAERSFRVGVVSSAEYSGYRVRAQLAHEQYAAATNEAADLRVIAPATGTLDVANPLAPGSAVTSGTVLAQIAAAGAPVIESSAPAAQRDLLRPGQTVTFTAPGINGNGSITEVASVIDASGTARVVAAISGTAVPPPGTGVEMRVALDHRRDVITVPEDALVAAADGPAVFVVSTSEEARRSRVKRVRVETAGRANGRVEIVSGLRDGDRVVVSGADALTDDSIVIEAEEPK
jgi:RND family efflux transporter MFP subunit